MATSLGGWFDKVFFDAHGEPCASGELRFYQTGTDIPQGVATFDGTPLGAVIRLDDDGRPESDFRFYTDKIYRVVVADADGVVVKTIDGVAIPEGEGGAMYNPMIAEGDLIVGATGGEPSRLGVGTDGDILATGNGAPTWEAGPKKYRNVYKNIPSSSIDDGYLGCLFYLSSAGQTLNLPSAASIPAKSFIDFVCIDDTATLTITPQGTTTLNAQGSAVTIGGKSASLYRLTFLGHGGGGDEWAVGGTDTATQPGDHQLLVSATDASAGYLGSKLTAGSNVTLTTQTDLDGVQTLEISAAGGGGGGSSKLALENAFLYGYNSGIVLGTAYLVYGFHPSAEKLVGFSLRFNQFVQNVNNFRCWLALYRTAADGGALVTPFEWGSRSVVGAFVSIDYDSPVTLDVETEYVLIVGIYPSSSLGLGIVDDSATGMVHEYAVGSAGTYYDPPETFAAANVGQTISKRPYYVLRYSV